MSADLIKFDDMPQVPVSQEEFDREVSSNFLPRFQLCDSNSKVCKKGLIDAGNYALIRDADDLVDLSNEVDALIIHMRWTAIDFNGEQPVFNHDKDSDEYKRIQEESTLADSGCLAGPEFLIYLPEQKSFATFFCCSKTSRRESKNIFKLLRRAATFRSHFIEKGKYSWYGPQVVQCSTPFDIPPINEIKDQVAKFNEGVNATNAESTSAGRER